MKNKIIVLRIIPQLTETKRGREMNQTIARINLQEMYYNLFIRSGLTQEKSKNSSFILSHIDQERKRSDDEQRLMDEVWCEIDIKKFNAKLNKASKQSKYFKNLAVNTQTLLYGMDNFLTTQSFSDY